MVLWFSKSRGLLYPDMLHQPRGSFPELPIVGQERALEQSLLRLDFEEMKRQFAGQELRLL